jgi:hypothetical protein
MLSAYPIKTVMTKNQGRSLLPDAHSVDHIIIEDVLTGQAYAETVQ